MRHTIIYAIPFRLKQGVPEFLVMQRAAEKFMPRNFWQMVSGTIEENEWSPETALREVHEETGLKATKLFVVDYVHKFWLRHWDSILSAPVFACELEPGDVKLSDEHVSHLWLNFEDAMDRLPRRSQKQALRVFYEDIIRDKQTQEYLIWEKSSGWIFYEPSELKL